MILVSLCGALALAAVLLLAPPAWGAERAPTPASTFNAASQADARALIRRGQFGDAMAVLWPLIDGDVIEANALFLYGLAAMGASQEPDVADEDSEALLDEAIIAFRAMLIVEPGLVRVRLELARAFFLVGEDDLARHHFERVLAGDPSEPVAANIERFLNQIRARQRWRKYLVVALAPDTNIGSTSDERIIRIFNLPFRRDAEELTASGVGISAGGGAEYQAPLAEGLRLRAGAETARREYERSQFDQHFLSGHVGPRWLVSERTEVSLLASFRRRWLGTAPDHHEPGARLEAEHRLSPRLTLSGRSSWHARRYRTRTWLDGPVKDASLRGAWVVTPTVRIELSVGYGRERPRRERERNRSRWIGPNVSVILPHGFTVGGGGVLRWTDYERGWFPFVPDGGPPQGPHTHAAGVGAPSRLHSHRFQPGARACAGEADVQCAAL